VGLEQAGAPLQVGEQEGDGAHGGSAVAAALLQGVGDGLLHSQGTAPVRGGPPPLTGPTPGAPPRARAPPAHVRAAEPGPRWPGAALRRHRRAAVPATSGPRPRRPPPSLRETWRSRAYRRRLGRAGGSPGTHGEPAGRHPAAGLPPRGSGAPARWGPPRPPDRRRETRPPPPLR